MRSNSTIFSNKKSLLSSILPIEKNCMMGVRDMVGNIDIYIPFGNLQENLKAEDVYKWVEIGNSLIFNSTIKEAYLPKNLNQQQEYKDIFNEHLKDLKVIRKDKDGYSQTDAIDADEGTLNSAASQANIQITKGNMKGSSWFIAADDYKVVKTGESLDIHIENIYKEYFKAVEKGDPNSFVISIDLNKCVSRYHKLAVLTFYRYLYSDRYPAIIKNTLLAIKAGINNWNALMIAHAAIYDTYTAYYGLTTAEIRSFSPMKNVLAKLKEGRTVNDSFTTTFYNGAIMSSFKITPKTDFKAIEKVLIVGNAKSFDVQCINDTGCSALTLNRIYTVSGTTATSFRVMADDYCNRHINKYRFKKV